MLTSVMRPSTSCAMSLSPVEITTSSPAAAALLRQRADDVVGLDALDAQQRQPERLDRLDQRLDLRAQVVRHRRAVRLVLGVQSRRGTYVPGASNTTAMRSGSLFLEELCSMFSTPSTAPVGSPRELDSGGRA